MLRSPLAMALLRDDAGTLVSNDSFAAVAGDRPPPALAAAIRDLRPDAAAPDDRMVQSVLAGQSHRLRQQKLAIRRDGAVGDARFDIDCSPVFDAAGAPAAALAIVVDCASRGSVAGKLLDGGRSGAVAEPTLQQAERRNRQILDSAIDYAIVAFDLNGKVTRWNQRPRRRPLGVDRPPRRCRDLRRAVWGARTLTGANYDTEFRIRRHDGAFRWHLVRAIALRRADGRAGRRQRRLRAGRLVCLLGVSRAVRPTRDLNHRRSPSTSVISAIGVLHRLAAIRVNSS